jgi:ComF family protein
VEDRSNYRDHSAGWLAEARDALVSVFFPADCRTCDRFLTRASRIPICDDCLASFLPLSGKLCEICGRPIMPGTENRSPTGIEVPRCALCRTRPGQEESLYSFDLARSYASYEGVLVRAILLLKFERMEPLGQWFAERLAELVRQEALAPDVVVPVPLHRQRERERGYNQADLIAKPLARRLKLPHGAVLLMRTRPRPDKHLLSLEERWESVRGAFATRAGSVVDNLRVLLVDDVMTTGATLDACARVLREAGAKSVIALTVARALRNQIRDPREPSSGKAP